MKEVTPRMAQGLCGLYKGSWLTFCPQFFSPKPDIPLFSDCSELCTLCPQSVGLPDECREPDFGANSSFTTIGGTYHAHH